MTSTLKVTTNRRNAEKSTGPKTEAGKAISALNAVSHGLSVQPNYDASTHDKIDNLADEFAAGDTDNTQIMSLAREAAEAQVMIERVKEARQKAWKEANCDKSIIDRGVLFALNDPIAAREYYGGSGMPVSDLKSIMPYMFEAPFNTDIEREIAVITLASKKLAKFTRYERRAANRRDKALRKLTEVKAIHN